MTPRKPAGDDTGGDDHDAPVSRKEFDEFKADLLKSLDGGGGGRRRSRDDDDDPPRSRPRGRQTDRDIEAEAEDIVTRKFAKLQADKDHDAHHQRLAEAEARAQERREKVGAKQPPAERNTLADLMGWTER